MEKVYELGALESKHAPSKGFMYFAMLVFILFSGISLLIYFGGIKAIQEERMNFSGDVDLLYYVIAILMALGIGMLFFAVQFSKGKTFLLYENGVVTDNEGEKKTYFFAEIEDVYLFSSGRSFITNNIAFRTRKEGQWEVITSRYKRVRKAIDFITARHQAIYVPQALQQLGAGKQVTFEYISYATALGKGLLAMGTKSFLKVDSKKVVVYKDRLVIGGKEVLISDLEGFSANNWIRQISIYDKNKKAVLRTSTNGMFSGLTFMALLEQLKRG